MPEMMIATAGAGHMPELALISVEGIPPPAVQDARVAGPRSIEVRCSRMACVPGPNGTRHHIFFEPTRESVRVLYDWRGDRISAAIAVEDREGRHSRDVPMRVLDIKLSDEVLVLTTDK
jgi:hypothetical protein